MAFPQIDTPSGGPLTAADLTAVRSHSTGNVFGIRGTCPPCSGDCDQGRRCPAAMPAEACTEMGADTEPGALSMARHRRTAWRVALALLAGPASVAVVAVAAWAAQHWPS